MPVEKKNKTGKNKTGKKKVGGARKTKKNYKKSNKTNSHIVKVFLEVLNMVKLYHWKTRSYAYIFGIYGKSPF